MESNRRKLIKGTAGAFAVGALAGCSDLLGDDDDEDPGEVTVSVLAEGSPDVAHACAHADDLGVEHDAAGSSDDAEMVDFDTHTVYDITVEGESGFIGFEMHDDDDDGHAHSHVGSLDHHEAFDEIGIHEFEVIDRDEDEVTAYIHGDHWHEELPHIHEGEHISLGAEIEDEDHNELALDGEPFELRVEVAHDAEEGIVEISDDDYHGDHVHINGDHEGETEVVFQIYNSDEDEVQYQTPPIEAEVEHHHDDGHDHDHDHMVFFTRDAQIEVEKGTLIQEATLGEGAECEDADEGWEKYVEIDPDHGEAMLEIQPE